ncbi:MAG: hydroxyacid dehydrogenase [Pseudomonadales bacterium]
MAKIPTAALVMHPLVQQEIMTAEHLERLGRATHLLQGEAFESFAALGDLAAEVDILITSWGCPPMAIEALDQCSKLKLIAHMAGSVKGFIDDAAWRRGIRVVNAAAAGAVPVAEFTLAAILFANKHVFDLSRFYGDFRENRAPWTQEAPGLGNLDKTVGIVGASHVGRLVMDYLRPFDLKVLLYDPFVAPSEARAMGAMKMSLTEVLAKSDVVSLHAPLLEETRQMIGARELALMASGTTLINTAHGNIVDTEALLHELVAGRLRAVLDVTSPEVPDADSPLFELPNVFLTPNISGSLGAEVRRYGDVVVAEVERFARGAALKHLIRRDHLSRLG